MGPTLYCSEIKGEMTCWSVCIFVIITWQTICFLEKVLTYHILRDKIIDVFQKYYAILVVQEAFHGLRERDSWES